jgi:hypothetical protein
MTPSNCLQTTSQSWQPPSNLDRRGAAPKGPKPGGLSPRRSIMEDTAKLEGGCQLCEVVWRKLEGGAPTLRAVSRKLEGGAPTLRAVWRKLEGEAQTLRAVWRKLERPRCAGFRLHKITKSQKTCVVIGLFVFSLCDRIRIAGV